MTRVLHLSHTCFPDKGGAQVYLKNLMAQQSSEHEVFLAAERKYCSPENFLALHKFNNLFCILINNIIVLTFVYRNKIEVIHLHHSLIDTIQIYLCVKFLRLFGYHIKVILTSHGIDMAVNKRFDYGVRRTFIRRVAMSKLIKVVDNVIAISRGMYDVISQYRHETAANYKINYIPNFITDKPLMAKSDETKTGLQNVTLLTLSGHRPIKGHQRLLQSIMWYCEKNPSQKFIWQVGGGSGLPFNVDINKLDNLKIEPIGYVKAELKEKYIQIGMKQVHN